MAAGFRVVDGPAARRAKAATRDVVGAAAPSFCTGLIGRTKVIGLLQACPAADAAALERVAGIHCRVLAAEAAEAGAVDLGAVGNRGNRVGIGGTQYLAAFGLCLVEKSLCEFLARRCANLNCPALVLGARSGGGGDIVNAFFIVAVVPRLGGSLSSFFSS